MEDLEGYLDVLGVLDLEHPVASGTGEDEGLDTELGDGLDVPLVDLHEVFLGPSDTAHDGTAADLVEGGEVHSQLLQDGERGLGGLLGPVGRGASREVCDGGVVGFVTHLLEYLCDGLLLGEGVVVVEDVLAHRLVLGQRVAVGHEIGTGEFDDVYDLHLGGTPPDAVRAGGAGVHALDDGGVGLQLSGGQTVGHDDTSPGEVGIPVDRFEGRAYALAEAAHGTAGEGVPDEIDVFGCEAHVIHSGGLGMVTLPSMNTSTFASGLAASASLTASATVL